MPLMHLGPSKGPLGVADGVFLKGGALSFSHGIAGPRARPLLARLPLLDRDFGYFEGVSVRKWLIWKGWLVRTGL
jgi:hypothetical protein